MEDFYNYTHENYNYTYENYHYNYVYLYYSSLDQSNISATLYLTSCILISIGLPLTPLAIYALYSQVKDNNVAPIFIINLLISDLIQMCCFAIWLAATGKFSTTFVVSASIHNIGLLASVGFMVSVAMERYLIITFPLWYRFRRTIKVSVVICVMVWILPFILVSLNNLTFDFFNPNILQSIFLLLPFPLLIFFLVGTLKALSSSISVSPEEKRRIMGILVLVLLNYTLLFLPSIISILALLASHNANHIINHADLPLIFKQFSPLVDLVLYVFMRKGALDKLLACLCRCKMSREQEQGQITTVSDNTPHMVSSM